MVTHPAIKSLRYGCSCGYVSPLILLFDSVGNNTGLTDVSCAALADLLRTVPTLKYLE